MRTFLLKLVAVAIAAASLGLSFAGSALAQAFPNKPIRLIVPFPPGGPADVLGRVLAQKMSEGFGQPVIVDNRPGANTIIGADLAAKSAPDGYTLFMAIDSTLTMNPALYTKLPYDPIKDFEPVSLLAIVPAMLVANLNAPFNTVPELIAYAKANPGKVMYGSGTIAMQLAGELFNNMTGTKMQNVPYKGGNTTISALMGGEIPLIFEGISTALPNWKGGKVKSLGAMGAKRLSQAPELATVAESGVPGYDAQVWQSIVVPAGTPRDIVMKLNAEVVRVMRLPETRERLAAAGIEPAGSTPD